MVEDLCLISFSLVLNSGVVFAAFVWFRMVFMCLWCGLGPVLDLALKGGENARVLCCRMDKVGKLVVVKV